MIYRTPSPYGSVQMQPHQLPVAWVNFNGISAAVIRDSRNITSVTRGTTGTYTVTMAPQAMAATEYITLGGAGITSALGSSDMSLTPSVQNTPTAVTVELRLGTSSLRDIDVITLAFMGRY